MLSCGQNKYYDSVPTPFFHYNLKIQRRRSYGIHCLSRCYYDCEDYYIEEVVGSDDEFDAIPAAWSSFSGDLSYGDKTDVGHKPKKSKRKLERSSNSASFCLGVWFVVWSRSLIRDEGETEGPAEESVKKERERQGTKAQREAENLREKQAKVQLAIANESNAESEDESEDVLMDRNTGIVVVSEEEEP